jgi:hypothetical protein
MLHKLLIFCFSLCLSSLVAQNVPQAFKYQSVIRDAIGNTMPNQAVSIQFKLLQDDGTNLVPVYTESHTTTTSNIGLITLSVGKGTATMGNFSQTDWSKPTFLNIAVDIAGGTTYLDLGAAELLSVPYALYAANAAGGSGLPADAEKGDLLYHDGTAWQRLPAGADGTVLTMGADGLPAWQAPSQLDSLIKVTMTNGTLIYTYPTDNSTFVQWGGLETDIAALANITSWAAANMDFSGEANTAAIVAQLGTNGGTPYAAKLCADLVAYGFDDWYLPAAGELNEMYQKLGPTGSGQMTTELYWSSSEYHYYSAWLLYFEFGALEFLSKDANHKCRCVRR